MNKKRNGLGQFTRDNFDIIIKISGPLTVLRAFILLMLFLPWIYFLCCKLNVLELWKIYWYSFLNKANLVENKIKSKSLMDFSDKRDIANNSINKKKLRTSLIYNK